MQNQLSELMQATMTKIREMVDTNTIVGQPIETPDGITVIPVSKVSFGFAGGGSDLPVKDKAGFGGGSGAGIRVDPVGFLVIKEGSVRMVNITPPPLTTADRVLEMVPDVIDRIEEFINNQKQKKE